MQDNKQPYNGYTGRGGNGFPPPGGNPNYGNMPPRQPYGDNMPQPTDNSRFKTVVIAAVVCFVVLCAAIVLIVYITRDDETVEIVPAENTVAQTPATGEITVEEMALPDNPKPEKKDTPPAPPLSQYGPFGSRQELMGFIEDYFDAANNGYDIDGFIADKITTDFGTPKSFTRSQFVNNAAERTRKNEIISSGRDYDWGTLKVTPQPDGGVVAFFKSRYYLDNVKDGEMLHREFLLTTTLTINSKRQISKYKEKTEKL